MRAAGWCPAACRRSALAGTARGFLEVQGRGEPLRSAPGSGGRRSLPPRGAAGREVAAGLRDRAAPWVHFAPRLQIRCAAAAAPSSQAQRRAAAAAAGSRIAPLPGSRPGAARLPAARPPASPPPPPAATPASAELRGALFGRRGENGKLGAAGERLPGFPRRRLLG